MPRLFVLCLLVSVVNVLNGDNDITLTSDSNLTSTTIVNMTDMTSSTVTYPTATWSANSYEDKKRTYKPDISKLYLFKPSPFLKPPFLDGEVGASISGIEYGADVMGRRTAKPTGISSDRRIAVTIVPNDVNRDQEAVDDNSHSDKQVDHFLEESLGKYLKSSNLSEIFGYISVDTFSEALKRVIQERKSKLAPYDHNKDLRRKFRDEVLFHKKVEPISKSINGVREKQYQRRLQKTWEILNETLTTSTAASLFDQEPTAHWFSPPPTATEVETTVIQEQELSSPFTTQLTTTESITSSISSFFPKKNYRGRTKFHDTVRNSIQDELGEDGEFKLTAAETSYYGPREPQVNTFTYKEEAYGSIPGEPGKDYPMLSSPPHTGFRCPRSIGVETKMMADKSTRCQVFYICKGNAPPSPMLCPNGTVFNEDVLVCDWWYNVDC